MNGFLSRMFLWKHFDFFQTQVFHLNEEYSLRTLLCRFEGEFYTNPSFNATNPNRFCLFRTTTLAKRVLGRILSILFGVEAENPLGFRVRVFGAPNAPNAPTISPSSTVVRFIYRPQNFGAFGAFGAI